ncbi:S8 family serine peptidase [Salinibacter ruber]|uniref:S8 family serine peptidase n=1 Tax=Salinibacter ruber TaxID=146919 RepID=UPI002073F63B|nr:S8 family serine peptidase [Salinibacter ruber]
MSTSYDNSEEASTRATEDIQSGDLPGPGNPNGFTQPVDVVEESPEPNNDEGRAMLQIIHDIAPGASLGFLSPFGEAGFVQGILQLAASGCDIIADDLTSYVQPMFQDGLISQAVDQVAQDQGVAYFNAAGNEGIASYARPFSGSGQPAPSVGIGGEGELHDFDPGSGVDVRQQIIVPDGGTLFMGLQWDDPFFRVSGEPGADTDLDLYLLDGETVVASSTRDNVGGDPWEILAYQNNENQAKSLDLAVALTDGPEPNRLKYVIEQGGRIAEHATDSPTVFAHNDAARTISVGASAWFNTPRVPERSPADPSNPPLLNGFSSKGGTPLLFDEDGNRLSEPVRRDKPDITATDGGNTTFFGSDVSDQIDTDNFPNFFGTSAASPHAAAVAALMLGVRSNLSPDQIEDRLEESAVDIQSRFVGEVIPIQDAEGYDLFSGTGLIRADRAVRSVLSARVAGLEVGAEAPGGEPAAPVSFQWQTVFERNSEAFVVERRPGPLTPEARASDEGWTQVGVVPSSASGGSSSDTLQYEFSGQVPTPGRYAFRLRHRTEDGPDAGRPVGAATEARVPIGGSVSVGGPQPNPSRGNPRVEVVVEESQQVEATLYDALGRRVQTLLDDRLQGETPRIIRPEGRELASGTYFLQIRGEDFSETRKLTVVR